jgi:hypothetical protein
MTVGSGGKETVLAIQNRFRDLVLMYRVKQIKNRRWKTGDNRQQKADNSQHTIDIKQPTSEIETWLLCVQCVSQGTTGRNADSHPVMVVMSLVAVLVV